MPPQLRRLRKRPEFLRVAGARQSWVTPGLILQVRRRDATGQAPGQIMNQTEPISADRAAQGAQGGPAQEAAEQDRSIGIGFTASRKVGNAIARNRARRRLRAVAAEVLPLEGRPGHDYVLIARGGTLTRPYIELAGDLRTALGRLASGGGARTGSRRRPKGHSGGHSGGQSGAKGGKGRA